MERLSFENLDDDALVYDDAVRRSSEVDRFCSSSFWILPATRHLMPRADARIYREASSYVVLAESLESEHTHVLHPLEAMWGLPCPLIGPQSEAVVDLFLEVVSRDTRWSLAFVTGILPESPLWKRLVSATSRRFRMTRGPTARRYRANLAGGAEGFLSQRSRGFRDNLRKAERRARSRGMRFEISDDVSRCNVERSFERILAIEERSWKGLRGVGIQNEPMRSFYRDMNERLVKRGSRRLTFASIDGEEVAYILGGVFHDTYRGLQFSFDHRYRSLSLGNLCQLHEIRRLAEAGIDWYDLGTEVQYKKRWGESVFTTASIVLRR